jgi:hypothetical protein
MSLLAQGKENFNIKLIKGLELSLKVNNYVV